MKLLRLHIENFFSFGEATLDFTAKSSPVLIKGRAGDSSQSNGSGKSSTLEAFYWSLTGKTVRGVRAADVIRVGEKSCTVVSELEFNSKNLKITRVYSAAKKTIEIDYNDKHESFHDSKQGTERIFEILGIRDDTLALACFYGSGFITFSGLGPQARSDVIDLLAQGSKWELARASAITQAKELEREASTLDAKWKELKSECEGKKEALASARESYKTKRAELDTRIEAQNRSIEKYMASIAEIQERIDALEIIDPIFFETTIEKLEKSRTAAIEAKGATTGDLITEGTAATAEIKRLQEALDVAKSDGNQAHRTATTAELRIETATAELKRSQTELETRQCASCGQALPASDDGEERSRAIQDSTEKLLKLEQELAQATESKNNAAVICAERNESIRIWTAKAEGLREQLTTINAEADSRVATIDYELASTRRQAHTDAQKSSVMLRQKAELETPLATARQSLIRLESDEELIRAQTTMEHLQATIGTYDEKIASALAATQIVMQQAVVIKFWSVAFKDIRFAAFDNTVNALESLLNSYAEQQGLDFDHIEVSSRKTLSTGKEKPQIEIYLHRGKERLSLDALSEGETQRVNIACFLAVGTLIEKHVGYALQLRIFDEPLGGVDADGKQKIFQIISDLADLGYQIFTIDHDAHFQDLCPTVITVQKTNGVSKILDA